MKKTVPHIKYLSKKYTGFPQDYKDSSEYYFFYPFQGALQNEMLKIHSTNSTLNQVAAS